MSFAALLDDALRCLRRLLSHNCPECGMNIATGVSTRIGLLTVAILTCLSFVGAINIFAPLETLFSSSRQRVGRYAIGKSGASFHEVTGESILHKQSPAQLNSPSLSKATASNVPNVQNFANFITSGTNNRRGGGGYSMTAGGSLIRLRNAYTVMVQTSGKSESNMEMRPFRDEEDFIGDSLSIHNRWPHHERLRQRFITVRAFLRGDSTFMVCAIYNTYGISDDGLGNATVSTWITAPQQDFLEWVVCDTATECKNSRFSNMAFATHAFGSTETNGWCVPLKPYVDDGLKVKFAGINNIRGIVLQSRHNDDLIQMFSDSEANGIEGEVDANGLVASGVISEMYFTLKAKSY